MKISVSKYNIFFLFLSITTVLTGQLRDTSCNINDAIIPEETHTNISVDSCRSEIINQNFTVKHSWNVEANNSYQDIVYIQKDQDWFGFASSSNNEITRFSFGNDLLNTPSISTLKGLEGFMNVPGEIDIVRMKNEYIGMFSNDVDGTLVGFKFKDISSSDSVNALSISVPSIPKINGLKLFVNNDTIHSFICSNTQDSLYHYTFLNEIQETPTKDLTIGHLTIEAKGLDTYFINDTLNLAIHSNNRFLYWAKFTNKFETPISEKTARSGYLNMQSCEIFPNRENFTVFFIIADKIYSFDYNFIENTITNTRTLLESSDFGTLPSVLSYEKQGGKDYISVNQRFNITGSNTFYVASLDDTCSSEDNIQYIEYSAYDSITDKRVHVSKPVFIYPNPEASLSSKLTCSDTTTLFLDSLNLNNSFITDFKWSVDNNETNTIENNTTFNFGTSGLKEIKLTITDVCGKQDSVIQNINIVDKNDITASFDFTDTLCTRSDVKLTNTSSFIEDNITSYSWVIRDAINDTLLASTDTNTSYNFLEQDTYSIYLKSIGESECSDDTLVTVSPLKGPDAIFTISDTCFGQSFLAFESSGDASITKTEWDLADTLFSTESSISFLNSDLEDKTITLRTFNLIGCITEQERMLRTYPLPIAEFDSTFFCLEQEKQVLNRSTISDNTPLTYQWIYNNNELSTLENPELAIDNLLETELTLVTTSFAGCLDTISKEITILQGPVSNFTSIVSCLGEPTVLTDSSVSDSTITNWIWDLNNASLSGEEVSFTFTEADTFSVKLTTTDVAGCSDTTTKDVIIDPLPEVSFSSTILCSQDDSYFYNTSSVSNDTLESAIWSFVGFGQIQDGDTASFSFPKSGDNLIQLNVTTKKGCESSETAIITINPKPTSDFFLSETIDAPTFTVIPENNSLLASTYNWNISEASLNSIVENPSFSLTEFGDYTVSLEVVTEEGCKDTSEAFITVVDPVADLELENLNLLTEDELISLQFNLTNNGNFELDSTILNIDFGGTFQSQQVIPNSISANESISIILDEQFTQEQLNMLNYICLTSRANESLAEESDLTNNAECIILSTEFRVNDVYPMPVGDEFTVNYFLPQEEDITIELYNSIGVLLYSISKESLSAGPQNELIDISNLTDEFYILTVKTASETIAKRITKL